MEGVEGGLQRQRSQDEAQVATVESQDSAVMAQFVLSTIGYVANGGLGLLVVGGIVSW